MKALFLDTETSGLPNWHVPSEDESQPHIVQLAAVLYDLDADQALNRMCLTVRPDGWASDDEAQRVHQIDPDAAKEYGVSEESAISAFLAMAEPGFPIIGYSTSFDMRILRIGICRYVSKDAANSFKASATTEDVMKMAKTALGIKGRKNPKLVEAYEQLVGSSYPGAHDAMADVVATIRVYQALNDGIVV